MNVDRTWGGRKVHLPVVGPAMLTALRSAGPNVSQKTDSTPVDPAGPALGKGIIIVRINCHLLILHNHQ